MAIPKQYWYNDTNNPSKEILASSGIYDETPYARTPYARDLPNRLHANIGTQTVTIPNADDKIINRSYNPAVDHVFNITANRTPPLNKAMLNDHNIFVDDMQVFNKYVHYQNGNFIRSFDPSSFLQQSIVNFNIYSLQYRIG